MDALNKLMGTVSAWVTLILAIPVIWTWVVVAFGRKRNYRRLLAKNATDLGTHPVIFGVDALPGKDMKSSVIQFCRDHDKFKDIAEEEQFWVIRKENLTPTNIYDFRLALQEELYKIAKIGANTIHLFYAGPYTAAAILGAELSNGPKVILYQHHQGEYINMGPLDARQVMGG